MELGPDRSEFNSQSYSVYKKLHKMSHCAVVSVSKQSSIYTGRSPFVTKPFWAPRYPTHGPYTVSIYSLDLAILPTFPPAPTSSAPLALLSSSLLSLGVSFIVDDVRYVVGDVSIYGMFLFFSLYIVVAHKYIQIYKWRNIQKKIISVWSCDDEMKTGIQKSPKCGKVTVMLSIC